MLINLTGHHEPEQKRVASVANKPSSKGLMTMLTPWDEHRSGRVRPHGPACEPDFLLYEIHCHEGAPVPDPPAIFYATLLAGFLIVALAGSATVAGIASLLS